MPQARKYTTLVLVVGVLVWADWASKHWADGNLASNDHPLPIRVTAAEAGETPAEIVAARYPDLAPEAERLASRQLIRLSEPLRDPDQSAYAPADGAGRKRAAGYIIFHHRDLDRAPRVVGLGGRESLRSWLRYAMPDATPQERARVAEKSFAEESVSAIIARHVVGYDTEEIAALVRDGFVYPALAYRANFRADSPTTENEIFLLFERKVDVIDGLMRFDYKENPGAAWGILADASEGLRRSFLAGVSIVAVIVLLVIFVRLGPTHWSAILAFSAILSGAIGNLIDRVTYGFVIDFVDMYISYMHWPTYNVADVGISVGVIALVLEMLFVKSSPFAQAAAKKSETSEAEA